MKYTFSEPHITGGHALITITEKQIIEYMKKKYKNKFSDKQLIEEFCAVNWCREFK